MDVEVKIKEDMKSLGCKEDTKICLAYHLYLYLIDEKLMYDTEYCYNRDIETLYVVARPSKNEKLNIYVPVHTSNTISLELIQKLQENLCTIETGPTINLAFIESDLTTVIYTFTKGLVELQPPDSAKCKQSRMQRRNFVNNELKKNRDSILNDALNGGVVDDQDCETLE